MRIHLWYSRDVKSWRWCITDRDPYTLGIRDRQETGEAKELDDAIVDIKKISEKWIGKKEPHAGWFGA